MPPAVTKRPKPGMNGKNRPNRDELALAVRPAERAVCRKSLAWPFVVAYSSLQRKPTYRTKGPNHEHDVDPNPHRRFRFLRPDEHRRPRRHRTVDAIRRAAEHHRGYRSRARSRHRPRSELSASANRRSLGPAAPPARQKAQPTAGLFFRVEQVAGAAMARRGGPAGRPFPVGPSADLRFAALVPMRPCRGCRS